jgi:hypothetical protein
MKPIKQNIPENKKPNFSLEGSGGWFILTYQ